MLRSILTVGGWTMASRVLGFLRDMLIAALLGAGPLGDAFVVANKLPNLFRRLFGEGAFNAAFVPAFAGLMETEGKPAAQRFAEQALAVMAFWLLGLTVLAEFCMPAIMAIVAYGFTSDTEKFALVVELGRITFPYMPLICLTALLCGVLNGLDRFAAAAAAPVVYNITSIACMLGLLAHTPSAGHALAWGVSLSGVFQLALLVWAVRRAGMRLHLPRPRLTPAMRTLFRRMAPGLIGAGVVQLNALVDVFIATLLPAGTNAILYFADRVNQLPLGTIGVAIGTALLPTLSRQAQSGQSGAAIATMNRAIEYALALALPATLALLTIPGPVLTVLFQRGAFTAADVALSAQALTAYAAGLPAFVLVKVLVPGFFARGDTAMPVKIGMASVGVNLALNFALMVPLQHLGPPLASALASWFNVAALAVVLAHRGHLAPDPTLLRAVPRMLAAGALMVIALLGLRILAYDPIAASPLWRWAGLCIVVLGGLIAYAIAGQRLGAFNIRTMTRRRS